VPVSELRNWHPEFNLESVPPIEVAELPELPHLTTTSALQLLKSSDKVLPPAIVQALDSVAKQQQETPAEQAPAPAATGKMSAGTQKLLERIRAKEAKRAEEHMHGMTPEQMERSMRIGRLPTLMDAINCFCVAGGRTAMYEDNLAALLQGSYHVKLGQEEMRRHLRLLVDLVPSWCSIERLDNGYVFKINRKVSVNEAKDILRRAQ